MNKKVSIITPSYNSENFISKAMDSVINQTYKDWEMLIVDDCSDDNTVELVKNYCKKDNRIKLFIQEVNGGAGKARNRAISESKGRYLAFLDSDDFWEKDKLHKQLEFMRRKNAAIVFSKYQVFDNSLGKPILEINPPEYVDFQKMERNDYIGFLTMLVDSDKTGKPLMPTIRRRQDWAYKLILLKPGHRAYCYPETLAYYRVGNQSLSSNKFKLVKFNYIVFRDVLGYSDIKSVFKMINFLIYHFAFKLVSRKKINR